MKCLLLTGVTGFLGSHCLRLVLRGGYDEIHAVTRRERTHSEPGVIWHAADLRIADEARRIIEAVRPTHLFHAAWIATPGIYLSSSDNFDWMQASIALVRNFAEQGGQRFVGVGSSAEYATSDLACDEDRTPLHPASIYGHCKLALWHAVQGMAQSYRLEAAWGRVFLPFGPGDAPAKLIPVALAALRAKKPMSLSRGEQLRDFIYAPDAAKLLIGLLESSATGAFNIGTGKARSVRSVVEAVAERFGARDCLRFGELAPRLWEPPMLVANMNKMHRGLGLEARTPFAEALDELIASAGRLTGDTNRVG
jgi:nucleoside-diphosphate-sugar epimerase